MKKFPRLRDPQRLGPGAFETISGHVVNVALLELSASQPSDAATMAGIDVSAPRGQQPIRAAEKAAMLRGEMQAEIAVVPQTDQLRNPDARISIDAPSDLPLLEDFAICRLGLGTGDAPHYLRQFWEFGDDRGQWHLFQNTTDKESAIGGFDGLVVWDSDRQRVLGMTAAERKQAHNQDYRGRKVWGRRGVSVSIMSTLRICPYEGTLFDKLVAAIVPAEDRHLTAVAAYVESEEFTTQVRRIDQKLMVTNATLLKVPFDLAHWQAVAAEKYPDGLPEPESDDPTQWLFHGRPEASTSPLQVAVARLLGYRWPAETEEVTAEGAEGRRGLKAESDSSPRSSASSAVNSPMRLSQRARALVKRCDELAPFADSDGIVCIPSVRGEEPAANTLRRLLAAAGVPPEKVRELAGGSDLDDWLRNRFFEEHCKLFHNRPFIWHIWDGKKDGFHALVNYHRLCGTDIGRHALASGSPRDEQPGASAPRLIGASGRRLLETLTYSYLGDWITRQQHGVKQDEPGAEARLASAKTLQSELEKILAGEPPYDIFVRWKPLHEQPIGWEPDINDGVRLNIRPFLMAKDVGRKGAGILRFKPNIKWTKDRGKEPEREMADFPWFWGWDEQTQDFTGGDAFDGNRWNDLHCSNEFKQTARKRFTAEDAEGRGGKT